MSGIKTHPRSIKDIKTRQEQSRKILDAVDCIVLHSGIDSVNIKSLSEETGINRAQIYRIFGSLEEIIDEYTIKLNPWILLCEISHKYSHLSLQENLLKTLTELLETSQSNPSFVESIKWDLNSSQDKSDEDLVSLAFSKYSSDLGIDVEALVTVLFSYIFYFIVKRDIGAPILGIDFKSKEGMVRTDKIFRELICFYLKNYGVKLSANRQSSENDLISSLSEWKE